MHLWGEVSILAVGKACSAWRTHLEHQIKSQTLLDPAIILKVSMLTKLSDAPRLAPRAMIKGAQVYSSFAAAPSTIAVRRIYVVINR